MAMFKSRKYLVALGIAVAAFVASFAVAFGGAVQWSREQPATLTSVEAVALSDTALTLYTDSALTKVLTPGGVIQLRGVKFLPPLSKVLGSGGASFGPIYARNNSAVPLSPAGFCCQDIRDPAGTYFGRYSIGTYVKVLNPGETGPFFAVSAFDLQPGASGLQFTIVLGALGETVDVAGSLSVQLEQVLKDAANQNK